MYLIPLAAVALASCSNESIDSQEKRVALNEGAALNIAPAIQGTRGTITTDANFTKFRVIASATGGNFLTTDGASTTPDLTKNIGDEGVNYALAGGTGTSFEQTVTLNASTGKWSIGGANAYWWQSKSMTGNFAAYAPYDEGFTPSNAYTVATDLADQKDVIVAYNTGTGSDFTSGVPLNFQHVMSQVIIKALNKDASTHKIEVAGIRLNGLKSTGTLTLPTSSTASGTFSWDSYTPWAVNSSAVATYKDRGTAADKDLNSQVVTLTTAATQLTDTPFLLMPQTTGKADLSATTVSGAYISVLIRMTKLSDGSVMFPTWDTTASATNQASAGTRYAYVAIPVDIAWNPGYKYTYTLNFSSTGIGKVDPTQPTDAPDPDATGFPTGKDGSGGEGGDPGDDIIDSPVQLYFTVTVDEWTDGGNTPLDM